MAGVGDRGNDRASTINKLLIMLAQAGPAQLEIVLLIQQVSTGWLK
jgi:hypothetical protein